MGSPWFQLKQDWDLLRAQEISVQEPMPGHLPVSGGGASLTLDFCTVSMLALRSSISAFMTCLSFSSLDLTLCRFSMCSVSSAMESVCFLRSAEAVASLCRAASSSSRRSFSSSASRLRFWSIWGRGGLRFSRIGWHWSPWDGYRPPDQWSSDIPTPH